MNGYVPSKQEIAEFIPILESLTGGKWKFEDTLFIMYEWSPDGKVVKDLFDYKEDHD